MLIRYIGKSDSVITEYDGKKYCFSKARPEQEIPTEVYNAIQQSRVHFASDILPVTGKSEKIAIKERNIEDEIDELSGDIEKEKGESDDSKGQKSGGSRKWTRRNKNSA